jgi:AcrR family transcriptional regulator
VAGLRAAQQETTRRLLLSTALGLFEAKGFAGTTRVTSYACFPSRSDLMRELIGELNETLERISRPGHGSTA